jgi:hypothetical protein
VCRNFLTETPVQQVSALVHELAHYVSGQPVKINDVVKKGRIFRPKTERLSMQLDPTTRSGAPSTIHSSLSWQGFHSFFQVPNGSTVIPLG